ncbi:hypothetical protein D1007_44052 [Hordeum vulgare]|nr:hypothetical protein D1007_44052 [Hordeum vulgare]
MAAREEEEKRWSPSDEIWRPPSRLTGGDSGGMVVLLRDGGRVEHVLSFHPYSRRTPLADNIRTKYTMLDRAFDKGHPARFIENAMMLPPMRMRGHGTTVKMVYNERYASFYKRARLLGYILQFKCMPPTLVHSAFTALINGWRPETHSFHLPCGEMTVTLRDWGMITALPIDGRALTSRVDRRNWEDMVIALIDDCPPAKANRTFDVPLPWLLKHQSKCLDDAEPRVVERHARAYLWYLLTKVNWEPYVAREWGFQMNVMCTHDRLLWRCIVPVICVYVVEYHMPHCVAAQFGKAQRTPPDDSIHTGGLDLHVTSRQKNQSIVDWGETHDKYVKEWNNRKGRKHAERRLIDWEVYDVRRLWCDNGSKYRLRLRP